MREAAFDELHRSFDGDVGWSDDEVEMVGHDDVSVQKIAGAVVIDGFEEERGVAFNLKKAPAVVGGRGDEVSARSGGAARDRHSAIVKQPQLLNRSRKTPSCLSSLEPKALEGAEREGAEKFGFA